MIREIFFIKAGHKYVTAKVNDDESTLKSVFISALPLLDMTVKIQACLEVVEGISAEFLLLNGRLSVIS